MSNALQIKSLALEHLSGPSDVAEVRPLMHTMTMQMCCNNRQDRLILVARITLRGLMGAEY